MTKLEKIKNYIEVEKELKESLRQSLRGALREATQDGHDDEYCELLEKSIDDYEVEIMTYKKILKLFEI